MIHGCDEPDATKDEWNLIFHDDLLVNEEALAAMFKCMHDHKEDVSRVENRDLRRELCLTVAIGVLVEGMVRMSSKGGHVMKVMDWRLEKCMSVYKHILDQRGQWVWLCQIDGTKVVSDFDDAVLQKMGYRH